MNYLLFSHPSFWIYLSYFTPSIIQHADDMEISPDFFDYFEAGAALMDRDKWGFWTLLISDLYLHYVQHRFLIKVVSNITVADPSWQFLHGMTMDKNSLYMIHVSWAQYFVQASIFLLKYIWWCKLRLIEVKGLSGHSIKYSKHLGAKIFVMWNLGKPRYRIETFKSENTIS